MMQKIKGKGKFCFERFLTESRVFRPTDMVNFDDVVAAAEEYVPSM
jgi:hypothetical protein